MISLVKRHPIITFFVLSYVISWAFLPVESVRFLPSGPLFAVLIVIAVRMVNPADGPLGEHPGWNGVALPGLQGFGYSPLAATAILAPLVAGSNLPNFYLEEGALQPSVLVSGLVVTMAVTFWYAWLFNHTGGSILLLVIAHNVEGSIQYELGWIVVGVWLAVAIGLVIFDWKAWRAPAPAEATTPPQAMPPRGAAPVTPA